MPDIYPVTPTSYPRAPGVVIYDQSLRAAIAFNETTRKWVAISGGAGQASNEFYVDANGNAGYSTIASAVAAASTATNPVFVLSAGTHNVSSVITIPSGATFRGQGPGSTIIQQVGNDITVFTTAASQPNWTIQDLTIKGTYAGTANTSSLIDFPSTATGVYGWLIQNVTFRDCYGWGIRGRAAQSSVTVGSSYGEAGRVSNCNFVHNLTGVQSTDGWEYVRWENCLFNYNSNGHIIGGGNHNFTNCNASYNTTGVQVQGGGNGGHGTWSGGSITHNATNGIELAGTVASPLYFGFCFSGVNQAASSGTENRLVIGRCTGVVFDGGYFSSPIKVDETNSPLGPVLFRNMAMYTNTNVITIQDTTDTSLADAAYKYLNFRDCFEIVDGSPFALGGGPNVTEAHTTSDTLLSHESGSTHTNTGASGGIVFTLPLATVGLEFYFGVGATQNLDVDPNGSEILCNTSGAVTTGGQLLRNGTIGGALHIKCLRAGYWHVVGFAGTWTVV